MHNQASRTSAVRPASQPTYRKLQTGPGNSQDQTSVLLFMAGGGVEADGPDVTSLH